MSKWHPWQTRGETGLSMARPVLIIVTGLPASGKSSLGQYIARELQWPYVSKDGIKETLFDTLGWKDREWSKQLGGASNELLWYFAEAELSVGRSLVVESNLHALQATPRILEMKARCDFRPIQVRCVAAGEVLVQRFRARERHPGHGDSTLIDEIGPALLGARPDILEIGGPVIEVDTTDWTRVDYAGLGESIRAAMKAAE